MCDSIDWMIEVACGLMMLLPNICGPPFQGTSLGGVNALLFLQRLVEMAVGAFERANESPLFRPAVPFLVLLLHFERIGLIVANARGLDNVCHLILLRALPARTCKPP